MTGSLASANLVGASNDLSRQIKRDHERLSTDLQWGDKIECTFGPPPSIYVSTTHRNPMFPVELSGVFLLRAATR